MCEDMESDAAMIVRQLERSGYDVDFKRVETAADMRSALSGTEWDIIISDFNIPGFGGDEALEVLKASGCDIPFILVSGTVGEDTAVTMMKAGANDYLMKNNLTRLPAAVQRELHEAAIRRDHRLGIEKLRANEAKYRAVIDQSQFAIFLARPDGHIQQANHAATEMFGYTYEELSKLGREDLLDSTDPRFIRGLKERTRTGKVHAEITGIRKGGERFPCEVSSAVFKDINGELMACALIMDISERKNSAHQLEHSNRELKALSRHLKNAREDERKYIAKEVHDQLGQLATAVKIDADWLASKMTGKDDFTEKRIRHMTTSVDTLLSSIRKIATSLRPSVLDDFGLNAAVQWQCNEFQSLNNIETGFIHEFDDSHITPEQKIELYRIAQESLTNVMRHAAATRVNVNLSENEDTIFLEVVDNGRGFDLNARKGTLGLLGIKERAASINGELHIRSTPGEGTCITVTIPKKPAICEY